MRLPTAGVMVFLTAFLAASAATDYYVNVGDGNDDWPGTQAQPWKTINKAVKTLQAGDTAYVAPGTYDISAGPFAENNYYVGPLDARTTVVRPQNSGTPAQPIRLIGQSTAAGIIGNGNSPSAQDDANHELAEAKTAEIRRRARYKRRNRGSNARTPAGRRGDEASAGNSFPCKGIGTAGEACRGESVMGQGKGTGDVVAGEGEGEQNSIQLLDCRICGSGSGSGRAVLLVYLTQTKTAGRSRTHAINYGKHCGSNNNRC